jgi:ribosomal protein L32
MCVCKNCGEKNLLKSDLTNNGCIYCGGYNADEIDKLINKNKDK